jgi:hypothetical protein
MGSTSLLVACMVYAPLVLVDWKRIGARFEDALYSKDEFGQRQPSAVLSLWNWTINFLTIESQPLICFARGFILYLTFPGLNTFSQYSLLRYIICGCARVKNSPRTTSSPLSMPFDEESAARLYTRLQFLQLFAIPQSDLSY